MTMLDILKAVLAAGASDLHMAIGMPPMVRVDGILQPLDKMPVLTADESKQMIFSLLSDEQRVRFEREWELDFSIQVENLGRFRVNVLVQKNGVEAVMRTIPAKIPTPEALELPPVLIESTDLPRGLVLVTGPTGAGKSTTLASLINLINQKQKGHILTLEDPIEFIYENAKGIVRQREVGLHTHSFAEGLKRALREDPDVVLIGELRDLETISAALTMAETGHLVFATLHTTDAAQTVDRIIDVFPSHQQQQVRTQLASTLKLVVCQTLVQKREGRGRVAAREILVVTPAVSNLIREGKTFQIYGAIDTGVRQGMISMDRALADLVKRGLISMDEALDKANRPELIKPQDRMAA